MEGKIQIKISRKMSKKNKRMSKIKESEIIKKNLKKD